MTRFTALALTITLLLASCASGDAGQAGDAPPATVITTTAPDDSPDDGGNGTTSSDAGQQDKITEDGASVDPSNERPIDDDSLVNLDAREMTPDTPSQFAVAYYGDSLAASAQEWVGTFLTQGGRLQFLPGTFPGSALCDWTPRFDEDQAAHDLWAVVLFFTNNTFSPCMKNDDGSDLTEQEALQKFGEDLQAAIDRFTGEGATVYLPTIPVSRGELVLGINPSEQLNGLFAELADGRDDVVLVEAGRAVLDENGNYTETLPCLPTEPCTGGVDENGVGVNVVREPDGVHFCSGGYGPDVPIETNTCPTWSSGAFRYGGALAAPIVAAAQQQWVQENPPTNLPDPVTAAE